MRRLWCVLRGWLTGHVTRDEFVRYTDYTVKMWWIRFYKELTR